MLKSIFSANAWQNLARDKADTLLVLIACLLVILPHTSHLQVWNSVTAVAVLLWRAYVTFTGRRMPPKWVLLPIALTCMVAVRMSQQSLLGRETGVSMLVILLALKLLEMHAKRDLFVVTLLSFFLILSNFLYSQSLATAGVMMLALLTILTAQITFQYTGKVPPLKQRLRHSAGLLLMAIPLTVVLFVLFPRIQGPLWGTPSAGMARTGLSNSMSPGEVSNLAQSEEIAFRVKFFDTVPPPDKRYWRGPVLGKYDGRTWTEFTLGDFPKNTVRNVEINALSRPIGYQVTLEPSNSRYIFGIDIARITPVIDNKRTLMTYDLQMLAQQAISKRVRYEISSVTDYTIDPNLPDSVLQTWLKLPPNLNPRTQQLVNSWLAKEQDPAILIALVLQYYRTEKFSYTLQPPPLGKDEFDDFLFTSRAGFCEHYAGSFVYLMRKMGIPARVVTGYQGGEINPVDGIMTIRQSNAHAWTEVWLQGQGWKRIDPTGVIAPERIETNLASALPRPANALGDFGVLNSILGAESLIGRFRNHLQAINHAWGQWVIDYTPQKQRNFFASMGFEDIDWAGMLRITLVIGAIVMAAIVIPLIRQQQKREPLDALYSALESKLAKRGLTRLPHEGPKTWAQRLQLQTNDHAVMQFLDLYAAQKYANHVPPNALATLKSLLKKIK